MERGPDIDGNTWTMRHGDSEYTRSDDVNAPIPRSRSNVLNRTEDVAKRSGRKMMARTIQGR